MKESHNFDDVLIPILYFLSTRNECSAREIKEGVSKKLNLFAGDLKALSGREGEPKVYNTIQNALRPNSNNFIQRVRRDVYRITPMGRDFLAENDEMSRWLNENYPDGIC